MEVTGSGVAGGPAWYRRRRWWIAAAVISLIAAIAAVVAVSWQYSSAVLVPDHSSWAMQTEVEDLAPEQIVLARNEDSERPGVYGLDWEGGHAIVGAIVDESDDTVTRRLRDVRGYLTAGMDVGVEANAYSGDPEQAFGIEFVTVDIASELGPIPSWSIPKPDGTWHNDTWAIVVHGINGTPQNGLRVLPLLHGAGLPTLVITYREDLGAPPSSDGYHQMGQTEWRDLESAVRYAMLGRARRLILVGYSMGGAIIAQFMQHSPLAARVNGLVLDAPVLDWKRVLEFNATEMGLPGFTALPVEWAIGARIDADWDSLDALQHPEDFHLPILLFHGDDDKVVPISTSKDFAAELPRWVTFHVAPDAGHVEAWNVNPRLYERRLSAFLTRTTSG